MTISMFTFRIMLVVAMAIVLVLSVGWGWQWVTSQKYRVEIGELKRANAEIEAERAFCESQRTRLYDEIGEIRLEMAALERASQQRVESANEIVERAEAEQVAYQRELERLRRQWPDDALIAVSRVREELGL